jgi:drug/metabolite transporter (DMT)-like permease
VLATWIIWGSTYLAIRILIESVPPLVTAGVRLLVAGLVLFGHSYFGGFRPTGREWRGALIVGAIYFLGAHGLLYWAERMVASGLAAVLMATDPMTISLILIFLGKERFSLWTLMGMICGVGGVAYLAGAERSPNTANCWGLRPWS